MRNWTRGYCRFCGDTIFHRNRCWNGHPVSAEAQEIHVKEVKHRQRKLQEQHGVGAGAAVVVPAPEQGVLVIEEER